MTRVRHLGELLSSTSQPLGGSDDNPMTVKAPLILLFEQDGDIVCHLHPRRNDTHEHYGLMICDLVRHVALAFKVDEEDVWEWVDKERYHPTTKISEPS